MNNIDKLVSGLLVAVLMSGFSISKNACAAPLETVGPVHGTTSVSIPPTLYKPMA